MGRFTISLDDDLATDFDARVSERGDAARSEAVLLKGQSPRSACCPM
jgi:metal-responsive CopG/Arc/MetJ family transcriptional regulator